MTTLSLIRLRPDPERFAAWAAKRRYLPSRGEDLGYALHAALAGTLGALAPKPFYWRATEGQVALFGYSSKAPEALSEAAQMPPIETEAASALNLSALEAQAFPQSWRDGRVLSFETRVRPVVRQNRDGDRRRFREVDVAAHAAAVQMPAPSKEDAYIAWVRAQLRPGAEVESGRVVSMRRTRCLRRPIATEGRGVSSVEGPDITIVGQLRVTDPQAFATLLSRGLGRHRAFGFGMLLIAPAGSL